MAASGQPALGERCRAASRHTARAASRAAESISDPGAGIFQGWNQSQRQSRGHGNSQGEEQRWNANGDFGKARQIRRTNRHEKAQAPKGKDQTENPAHQSQQQAFDEHGAEDARGSGA